MNFNFASEKLCDFISTVLNSITNLEDMNAILQETVNEFAEELQLGKLSVTQHI